MDDHQRSGCPINLTLEVVGDKWSLLIIRDMMFGNRRHFRELLTRSEEGIASNILADRLKRLVEQGIAVGQRARAGAAAGGGRGAGLLLRPDRVSGIRAAEERRTRPRGAPVRP